MFIVIVEFPPVRKDKEQEFKEWFSWSNSIFEKSEGLISRRLLKSTASEGKYLAIVEHRSEETFKAMHSSEKRNKIHERLLPLLEGSPKPGFYEVVVTLEKTVTE
jgi:heme-degrading monooxygenase HmoA